MQVSKLKDTLTKLVLSADPNLKVIDRKAVYNASIMYLFRGFNYRSYAARLQKLQQNGTKVDARAITEAIGRNGYLIKNLKLWIFWTVKNRLDVNEAHTVAKQWGILKLDRQALAQISPQTLTYLKSLCHKFKALSLENFERHLVNIDEETRVWLGKFVSRKLRFIYESQGLKRTDIEQELRYKGIQGLYMMYPCVQSALHAQNVVKRTIHNNGINMIYKATTMKAGRLVRDASGTFQSRVIALDEAQLSSQAAPETRTDYQLDFQRLLERYSGKRLKFIELMSGHYCEWFSHWLIDKGHKLDNDEVFDKVQTGVYAKLVADYLGVNLKTVAKFIDEIKSALMHYTQTQRTV
jgi:hypothetical protein